jgi:membrane-associated phospholipid phosphatase
LKNLVKPVEYSFVIYITLSLVFILAFNRSIDQILFPIVLRIISLVAFASIVYLTNYEKIKFTNEARVFLPFLLISFYYSETDLLNNLIFNSNFDGYFAALENQIFQTQPSLIFSIKMQSNFFAELMYFGYFSYYLMVVGVPLYTYIKLNKQLAERLIFIVITSFLIYYAFFIIVPVAGPQFYFKNYETSVPNGYLFGGIIKIIQFYGEGETAAFPSSHVSICLMLLWFIIKNAKRMFYIMFPITVLLILSTVYLRAHYIIDIIAAFIVTPILYQSLSLLYKKLTEATQ